MKNLFIFLLASTLLIQACNKDEKELDKKKKELTDAKKEFASLKEKVSKLEKEVAKLEGKTEQKGKPVMIENVAVKDFSHFIEVQGRVKSDQNVVIGAESMGSITRIYVQEGETVRKGKLLAEIDPSTILSQIQGVKTQVEFARTMFEKQKRLREQNVGTEVQYIQSKTQLEAAEAQLSSLQAMYQNTRITSPIDGVIDAKFINEGTTVAPGIPTFSVVGGSGYKVTSMIAESYLNNVRKGLEVLIYFPDIKQEIKGTISNISQTIDPASRTFSIDIKIKDNAEIRPNLIAVVKIKDYQNAKTITVPVNSIQRTEEGEFVFVAKKKASSFLPQDKWSPKAQLMQVRQKFFRA
ncbi:MAG: efflux RND transporter periplasmic adaptor subunit [Cytophagaceae bacterium]|nr:efflux RND transporter periplasmic adaptor subunit [Cytophagaceae bacterium]